MTEGEIIQIVVTIGGIISAMLLTIRYAIAESNKKQKEFLDFIDKMETKQLEYYETKNGHLERISKLFSSTIAKNNKAVENLSAQFKTFISSNKK